MKEQPFYIGQKVVCLETLYPDIRGEKTPKKDVCYTVRSICFEYGIGYKNGTWAITLIELVNKVRKYDDGLCEALFAAKYFAPLQEGFEAITFERVIEEEKVSVN